MIRKLALWAGVVTLFTLGILGMWGVYGTHTKMFSEAQVQEQVNKLRDKSFEITGIKHLLVKRVTLTGATVHIEDGHVTSTIDVTGALPAGKTFTMSVRAVGAPRYSGGAFFFSPENVEVKQFAYEGGKPVEYLKRFTDRYIADEKHARLVTDLAPKAEEWMTAVAQNVAIHALEKHPVYRLKDDLRGVLIKASLESVVVADDHIVVTFSLWKLTISVFLGMLALIAAAGMMLMLWANPALLDILAVSALFTWSW